MNNDLFAMFQALESQEEVRDTYVRAPFGYVGGKSRSLPYILPHLPYTDLYVEVFGGSGAVLLARNKSKLEVFNDRHSGVIAFYRCIRDRVKMNALLDRLQLCLHSREEFIFCKNSWKDCTDDVERAARWYYSIQCSFAGIGRNFGRVKKGKNQLAMKIKNHLPHFPEVHLRMMDVQVENLDWRYMLKDYDSKDSVFYLDPPYYTSYSGTYEHELSTDDHKEMLERIFQCHGFVALSGYPNPLYESYPWDKKFEWEVRVTAKGMAGTQTNNKAEIVIDEWRDSQEILYIKECK